MNRFWSKPFHCKSGCTIRVAILLEGEPSLPMSFLPGEKIQKLLIVHGQKCKIATKACRIKQKLKVILFCNKRSGERTSEGVKLNWNNNVLLKTGKKRRHGGRNVIPGRTQPYRRRQKSKGQKKGREGGQIMLKCKIRYHLYVPEVCVCLRQTKWDRTYLTQCQISLSFLWIEELRFALMVFCSSSTRTCGKTILFLRQ